MKTPSLGLDQNEAAKFVDRYWGRVPQFLLYMPETFTCEPNPDYLLLLNLMASGHLMKHNVSIELWRELEWLFGNVHCVCLLTNKEQAIMNAFLGGESCAQLEWKLPCGPGEVVCCNQRVLCEEPTMCDTP